jgi:hypothetical protein
VRALRPQVCAWLEAKNFLLAPPRYRIDSAEALHPTRQGTARPHAIAREAMRCGSSGCTPRVVCCMLYVASLRVAFLCCIVALSLRCIVALGSLAWAQELGVKLVLVGPIDAGKTSLLLRSALRL